jgi:hypothetical protein
MVQIFIDGLKPEIKNEMLESSWLTLSCAFKKADELENHAEQQALATTNINETSVDYMGNTSNHGNYGVQRGQNRGRANKSQNQQRGGYTNTSTQPRGGHNASSANSSYTLSNTNTKPQRGSSNLRKRGLIPK